MARTAVLLVLAVLAFSLPVANTSAARLAKPGSTHPSFPMDVFSKPAYKLVYADDDPISNHSAIELLLRYGQVHGSQPQADIEAFDRGKSEEQPDNTPSKVYLERTSPDALHICSIPKAKPPRQTLNFERGTLEQQRSRILRRALELLSPLKQTCLYHTLDWFTYSFCYGDAIRQFRALPGTTAPGKTPGIDSREDSYVLGRWNDGIEVIDGESHAQPSKSFNNQEQPTSTEDSEARPVTTTDAAATNDGTELMELVRFPSLDTGTSRPAAERNAHVSAEQVIDGGDGRYVSQIWSSGTLCNINNEPRTTEVQFHCSSSPPVDRISLIKETTTCNYVVVIDTPKLCEEPALAPVEEDIRDVRCRPIVSDEELKAHKEGKTSQQPKGRMSTTSEQSPWQGSLFSENVRAAVQDIASKIAAKKTARTDQSGDGPVAADIELVVGYDGDGRIMIEPRNEHGGTINVGNEAPAAPQEQPGTHAHNAAGNNANTAEAASDSRHEQRSDNPKSKWDELVQRFLALEDEIIGGLEMDGIAPEEYFVMEPPLEEDYMLDEDSPEQLQPDAINPPAHPAVKPEAEEEEGEDAKPAPVAASNANGALKKGNAAPSRGGSPHMVRETETLGQRVERHYKLRENREKEKQRENEAHADVDAGIERNRAEL